MGRLPEGYTELEYIESTGEQWIVFPEYLGTPRLVFRYLYYSVNNCVIFNDSGQVPRTSYFALNCDGTHYYNYRTTNDSGWRYIGTAIMLNVPHSAEYGKSIVINGEVMHEMGTEIDLTGRNIRLRLFGSGYEGSKGVRAGETLLYDGSLLQHHAIPARRDSDGVVSMYDLVSETFLPPQGTKPFIAGPALLKLQPGNVLNTLVNGRDAVKVQVRKPIRLPAGYTELEYIQSTGEQWIDTGIVPTVDTRIETTFEILGYSQAEAPYGAGLYGSRIKDRGLFCIVLQDTSCYVNYTNQAVSNLYILPNRIYKEVNAGGTYTLTDVNSGIIQSRNVPPVVAIPVPISLFGRSNGDEIEHRGALRVWLYRILQGDSLVGEYIPARRDSDGVVSMFDLVSETFLTPQGTGEFLTGPEINPYATLFEATTADDTFDQTFD